MIHLLKFEFKKFFYKKKNLMLILILFLITVAFIFLNLTLDKSITKSKTLSIEYHIESVKSALLKVDSEISRLPSNTKLKNIKNTYEFQLSLLQSQHSALNSNDWIKVLESQIKIDKNLVKDIESGFTISPISVDEITDNININSILLEKKIKPINENSSMQFYNFLKLFLDSPLILILIIAIIIFTADTVSSEVENKTINLLLTQPISKRKIILSKILSSIFLMIFIMFSIILLAFLFLGFTQGFGDLNYPTRFLTNGMIDYVSLGKFLLYLIPNFILLIIFTVVLSIFISTITNQAATSSSITILLTISTYMIINYRLLNKVAHLIPFSYISLSSLLQGNLAKNFDNINVNSFYAPIVLIAYTLIILTLTIIIFNNKSNYN